MLIAYNIISLLDLLDLNLLFHVFCALKQKKNRKKGQHTRYFQLTQTQNELHVDVPLLFRGQLGMDRNLKVNFN
jgi:hypothetical protein